MSAPAGKSGTVYVLHFDQPTVVRDADNGHIQPTTHYVGWTSHPVQKRVREHAVPMDTVVSTQAGTTNDEALLKQAGRMPTMRNTAGY